MNETEYIILRKTPFRESSLIVSGISPHFGKIDFIMRTRSSGKTGKFPVAGLFRELHVEFNPAKEDGAGLIPARSVELIRNHDAVAENVKGYFSACDLASMLLCNTNPMVEIPGTFQTFKTFLNAMEQGKSPEPYESLVYLVLLEESGELPPQEGRAGAFLTQLLNRVRNGLDLPPDVPESYWSQLADWRKVICRKMPGSR